METFRTLVGWLLFLAMAVVAGFFWHQSAERGVHIALLSNTVSQMESQIDQLSENIDDLEQQITDAMKTIIDMKNDLERYQSTAENQESSDQKKVDTLDVSLGDIMDSFLQGGAADTDDDNPLGGMMEMFQTPQGEQMLKASIKMTMNMQYGDFFDMLAPEHVDAVREVIGDYMMHSARFGINFMSADGDENVESAMEGIAAKRETLLNDLRAVIGDDGIALYEEYERELPGRMMEQSLEMQLGMFTRGLSEDVKGLVRQTLVEELIAVQPEVPPHTPPSLQRMQSVGEDQAEAYARALDRLAVQLSEEDFNTVQEFVEQQQRMADMFGTMMLPDNEEQ